MSEQNMEEQYFDLEVDRMINEGLGGGYIDSNNKEMQLEIEAIHFVLSIKEWCGNNI